MVFTRIGQFGVDFIRDHVQVMFQTDLCHLLEILPAHDGAGRIVREREDQNLGLIRDMFLHLCCGKAEFILLLQGDRYRNAVCQSRTGDIGDIARLRDQHFIARIEHGPEGQIDRLRSPHRDKALAGRIIDDIQPSLQILCNFSAQFHQTCVRSVEGLAPLQGIDALIAHRPRRVKIRLSDAKRDHIIHLGHNIEKLPDPRRFQAFGLFGKQVP